MDRMQKNAIMDWQRKLWEEFTVRLDFSALAALLAKDSVLTYKMQYQLFHAPLTKDYQLWFADGAAMFLDHSLHMYGSLEVLDRFLTDLTPGRTYSFFGVTVSMLPLLENHFAQIEREEDCSAYTLSPEDFREDGGQPLESLTAADAEYVNDHWTYKHEGSLKFFRHILAVYPSSAARINGQLAGWAVCYDAIEDMVNLGSLRVLDQHRNQGLGRKLAADLARKVLRMGKIPMVHILDNNTASKTLSMGIGFKPYPHKIFWGSGLKK